MTIAFDVTVAVTVTIAVAIAIIITITILSYRHPWSPPSARVALTATRARGSQGTGALVKIMKVMSK